VITDVHAHCFPPRYGVMAAELGLSVRQYAPAEGSHGRPAAYAAPPEDISKRISAMDEAGVERQILSHIVAPYLEDRKKAIAAASLLNDELKAFCANYPDRLSFWAALPLPHVDAAIEEMKRVLDDPGAVGVTLQCFCLGKSIAVPEFDSLYAELDRRAAVVLLHPCQNAIGSAFIGDWGLTACLGASVEDSVAAAHLIIREIPTRFPRIRFIVPHFGGILPMLLQRLDGQLPFQLTEKPSITARRFFYDTVGWGSRAALAAAHMAFGAERLVPGSDWPVLLQHESYATTFDHIRESDLLSDADKRLILHHNVQQLLDKHTAPEGRQPPDQGGAGRAPGT